jgi:two-component system, cell cycle response regulator
MAAQQTPLTALTDRLEGGLYWTQQHWATSAGAGGALAVLAATALNPAAAVTGSVAAVALGTFAVGLLTELVLVSRANLQREHRLVDQSATLRLLAARLEDMARLDAVTGVANRRALTDDLTAEVQRAARYQRPLSVLLIDIDHFKRVNDTYGHQFGDAVLASTAATLRETLRASDSVARYGGEEFVITLPETTLEAAAAAAEKLRAAVESRTVERDGTTARVTISVGVAALDAPAPLSAAPATEATARLLASADAAMYAAKHAGRNRVVTTLELDAEAERRAA